MNLCDSYLNLYVLSKTYTDRNIYEKIAKSQRYIIMVYFNIKSFYNQTNVAMHLQIVQKKIYTVYIYHCKHCLFPAFTNLKHNVNFERVMN